MRSHAFPPRRRSAGARGAPRPEDGNADRADIVGEAIDQRHFGADHDQPDLLATDEIDDRAVIRHVERSDRRMLRDAGVAGRGIERI